MKNLYEYDQNCVKSWKENKEPWSYDKKLYLNYSIQKGFIFKNINCVFQDNL